MLCDREIDVWILIMYIHRPYTHTYIYYMYNYMHILIHFVVGSSFRNMFWGCQQLRHSFVIVVDALACEFRAGRRALWHVSRPARNLCRGRAWCGMVQHGAAWCSHITAGFSRHWYEAQTQKHWELRPPCLCSQLLVGVPISPDGSCFRFVTFRGWFDMICWTHSYSQFTWIILDLSVWCKGLRLRTTRSTFE